MIEDSFFSQYGWSYRQLCVNNVDDIIEWFKAIRRRKKSETKLKFSELELLTYAIHTQDATKFGESLNEMSKKLDEEDEVIKPKTETHEGYYPDEEVDTEQIDRLKAMREYHGMQ